MIDASRVQVSSKPKITNQNSFSTKWEIKLWSFVEKQSEIYIYIFFSSFLAKIFICDDTIAAFGIFNGNKFSILIWIFENIYIYILICSDLSSFPLISSQYVCHCTLAFFRCIIPGISNQTLFNPQWLIVLIPLPMLEEMLSNIRLNTWSPSI